LNHSGELSFEFYDIAFMVSQLRTLNRRINKCFMNIRWPYIKTLPSYFYRIYLPSINNMSSILNSNYDPLSFSTLNSTNRYENELFSDNLNSNSIDMNISTTNETNIWSTPSWCVSDLMSNHHSCSSSRIDDITVSIRW